MRDQVSLFKALSDSNRIRILYMLNVRSLCVCEIQSIMGLAVSTVSKHLAILRHAGFIIDAKENKWVNYSLNAETANPVVKKLLKFVLEDLPEMDIVKDDLEKVKTVDRNLICGV